jgi:hypothetical protein
LYSFLMKAPHIFQALFQTRTTYSGKTNTSRGLSQTAINTNFDSLLLTPDTWLLLFFIFLLIIL